MVQELAPTELRKVQSLRECVLSQKSIVSMKQKFMLCYLNLDLVLLPKPMNLKVVALV